MSAHLVLNSVMALAEPLLAGLQPEAQSCGECRKIAGVITEQIRSIEKILRNLSCVKEYLLSGGAFVIVQQIYRTFGELSALVHSLTSGRASHAGNFLTRLFTRLTNKRSRVHEDLRVIQNELSQLLPLLQGVEYIYARLGEAALEQRGEPVPVGPEHRATLLAAADRMMADSADCVEMLRELGEIKGLRELDPFWYSVRSVCASGLLMRAQHTVSHSRLRRILHATHAAITHSLNFSSAFARLLAFCVMQPIYVLVPRFARARINALYHSNDDFAVVSGPELPFRAASAPPSAATLHRRRRHLADGETGHSRSGSSDFDGELRHHRTASEAAADPLDRPFVPASLSLSDRVSARGILTEAPRAREGGSYLAQISRAVFAVNEIPPLRWLERRMYLRVRHHSRLVVSGLARALHLSPHTPDAVSRPGVHSCAACDECAGVHYEIAYDCGGQTPPTTPRTSMAAPLGTGLVGVPCGHRHEQRMRVPVRILSTFPLPARVQQELCPHCNRRHSVSGTADAAAGSLPSAADTGVPITGPRADESEVPPASAPERTNATATAAGARQPVTDPALTVLHHPLPPILDALSFRAGVSLARSFVAQTLQSIVFGVLGLGIRIARSLARGLLWGPVLFAVESVAPGVAAFAHLKSPMRPTTRKTELPAPPRTYHAGMRPSADGVVEPVRSPVPVLSRMSLGGILSDHPALKSLKTTPLPDEAGPHRVVLHFHGGGFMAQSSDTHQHYLRLWAHAADCVVISVDYSLTMYPRAVLECYMVYRWLLDGHLGFVPSQVVLAGDSAGGNLACGVTLKAMLDNVRVPDGLFLFYPAVFCLPAPTPSRLMCSNDPVIPRVMLAACLETYLPHMKTNPDAANDVFVSPGLAPDELLRRFPPTRISVGTFDPLLDDAVEFARRLTLLAVDTHLHVHEALPHGYMNLQLLVPQAVSAIEQASAVLAELFETAAQARESERVLSEASRPPTLPKQISLDGVLQSHLAAVSVIDAHDEDESSNESDSDSGTVSSSTADLAAAAPEQAE